ncbi:histidine phosphatase family protein [Amycolatopsis lurida]
MTMPEEPAEPEYRQRRFTAPPGAADLLLIRHGESAPARASRPFPLVDGQGDPELAPDGLTQAELIAKRLGDEHFDAIYVTPLQRTAQTAAPLAARLGLTPRLCPELREIFLGEWEGGVFRQKVAERDPLAERLWAEERWSVAPGAEDDDAFAARVRTGIERIAADHPDQRVAVFTHGGVIGQALALAARSRPFAFVGADNGSISQLVVHGPQWIVRRYNDIAHLTS